MKRDRWTFLLFREDSPRVTKVAVNASWLRIGAVAGGISVLLILVSLVYFGIQGRAHLEARSLAEENRILSAELEEMRGRVGHLETRIGSLSEESARFRTLAGLDAIPSEVMDVGVGGPGTETPEDHPLHEADPELSEVAFTVDYDVKALERRARLLTASLAEARDSLMAHRELLESTPSILPTSGWLSSGFSRSRYHPIHHRPLPHEGVDIAAQKGTPILAAAKGRVVTARWQSGYGLTVEIDHGFGYTTRYGHADKILVQEGQEVERGDVIAQVGETGIATAPNLHYEVLVGGQPTNPMNYVISDAVP